MTLTRHAKGLALAAALASCAATPVFAGYAMPAPEGRAAGMSNWYLGGMIGAVTPNGFRVLSSFNGDTYSPKFQSTYDLSLLFGYRASTFRFEGQFAFVESPMKSMRNTTTGTTTTPPALDFYGVPALRARIESEFVMANMYYDFQGQSDKWGMYLGLGVGWANLKEIGTFLDGAGHIGGYHAQIIEQATEGKLAYQGMFGVTYNPDNNFLFDLGLRYLATTKLTKIGNRAVQYPMVNLGVTYHVPA